MFRSSLDKPYDWRYSNLDEELDLRVTGLQLSTLETSYITPTDSPQPKSPRCRCYSGYVSSAGSAGPSLVAPGFGPPPGLGGTPGPTPLPPGVVSRSHGVSWYLWGFKPTGACSPCCNCFLVFGWSEGLTKSRESIWRNSKYKAVIWTQNLGGFDGKWIPLQLKMCRFHGWQWRKQQKKNPSPCSVQCFHLTRIYFGKILVETFFLNWVGLVFSFRLAFWVVPSIPRLKISLDAWKLWWLVDWQNDKLLHQETLLYFASYFH